MGKYGPEKTVNSGTFHVLQFIDVLKNNCSKKCYKIYKKTRANKFAIPGLLRKGSIAGVFQRIMQKKTDSGYFTKHRRAAVSVRRLKKPRAKERKLEETYWI